MEQNFFYVKGEGLSGYVGTDMSITGEIFEDSEGNIWINANSYKALEHQGEQALPEDSPDSGSNN